MSSCMYTCIYIHMTVKYISLRQTVSIHSELTEIFLSGYTLSL